ncbi:hypothetical protein QFC19_004016 [Naganishia cerealis]|uniref:Uncharacterized protein n=1 Tax=Naganishia cerealis TaxID=610337 RepID=A0ACC2VXK2_9TREE|nr:hypothetical protein QFC19_004016 [Naganishia cerealis]
MFNGAANKHQLRTGQSAPPIVSPIHVTVELAAKTSSKDTAFSTISSLDIGPSLIHSLERSPAEVNPPAALEQALEPVKDNDAQCEQHLEPDKSRLSTTACDKIWEYRCKAVKDFQRTKKQDEKLLELVNGDRCPNERAPKSLKYARPQGAKGFSKLCQAHQKALIDSSQEPLKRVESAPARLETLDDIDEYEIPQKREVAADWRRRLSLPAINMTDAQTEPTPHQIVTAREAFLQEQHSNTQWFLARQAMRKWLNIRAWEQEEAERKLMEIQAWEARHPGKKGPKVIVGGFVLPEMQAVMGAKVPYAHVASAIEQYVQSEQCPEEDKRIQAIYARLGRPRAS